MTEKNYVTEDDHGDCFEPYYPEYIYINIIILIYSWYHGGEQIHISIMNNLKWMILKLLICIWFIRIIWIKGKVKIYWT